MSSWRKRLDFEALDLCDDPDCKFCVRGRKKLVKFITQELKRERERKKNVPMGVSQWLNYGEKFGYAKWWKKEIKKEMGKVLRKEIKPNAFCELFNIQDADEKELVVNTLRMVKMIILDSTEP